MMRNMLALRSAWQRPFLAVLCCVGLLQGCTGLKGPDREPSANSDAEPSRTSAAAVPPLGVLTRTEDQKDGVLELFPAEIPAGTMALGWEKWILHPLKRKTDYGWKKDRKGVYVEAKSRSSASGLIKRLDIDPVALPHLQFSWMIDGLLEGADVADRASEDSPVRVVLAFDGDKSSLPMKDRAFIERVKTFTGQDIPYASLVYIWDNKRSLNTIVANPHSGRIQKLVASSGSSGVRSWQVHHRNIVKDFRAAYGKEPGKLIAIGIMTDTDNTKTNVQARYRDLSLLKAEPVGLNLKSQ